MQVCCALDTASHSLLLGIGPSSCAASSSWWQWQGCPPHPSWQPAPELCQWQSVCLSSQHQHCRETATTNYLLDLPSPDLNKSIDTWKYCILHYFCQYPVVSFLIRLLLKVLLKDLRIIAMVVISFIEKIHEESLIKYTTVNCLLTCSVQVRVPWRVSPGPLFDGGSWGLALHTLEHRGLARK